MEALLFRTILELRALVASSHRTDLPPGQLVILLLEFFGLEVAQVAALMHISPQTVKNQAHQARTRVVPPSLPATRANATLWCALHQKCCLATALSKIEH